LIAAGRPDEAMAALRAAYFEAPESRLAAHWQDLARRLAGGSRGATRP
jgi:hypothetical protein